MFTDTLKLKNDEALITGCIEGVRICQNLFYKKYASKMMGICLRYAKSKEDAEDILQEGFIQVFLHIHQYKFKGTPEAWLKRIFINCALQKLREKESKYLFTGIDMLPEKQSACYTLTEEEIDAKILIRHIQNLPLMCRLVFNLYVFEGLKHKEIAGMLKISEGTSKSNLFDARNLLKKQLEQFDLFNVKKSVNG